ncbi:MAG TPA: hypothetical protein VJH03_19990 [Blastocatellia bacterium]|nr:hypothetical protein [Blastocatellia bacterium]
MIRRIILAMLVAVFAVAAMPALPSPTFAVYAQKKDDGKKKDPPGPPVVKEKEKRGDTNKPDKSRPKDPKKP